MIGMDPNALKHQLYAKAILKYYIVSYIRFMIMLICAGLLDPDLVRNEVAVKFFLLLAYIFLPLIKYMVQNLDDGESAYRPGKKKDAAVTAAKEKPPAAIEDEYDEIRKLFNEK
mgnify:FL=1